MRSLLTTFAPAPTPQSPSSEESTMYGQPHTRRSMLRRAARIQQDQPAGIGLVVVVSALPFRMGTISAETVADQWPVILNLLAGSVFGAWCGASWATRLR